MPFLLKFQTQKHLGLRLLLDLRQCRVRDQCFPSGCAAAEDKTREPPEETTDEMIQAKLAEADLLTEAIHKEAVVMLFRTAREAWDLTVARVGSSQLPPVELVAKPHPERFNAKPFSPPTQAVLDQQMKTLLERDLIEEAPDCPYVTPLHFVQQKDKTRIVFDYRWMNKFVEAGLTPSSYRLLSQARSGSTHSQRDRPGVGFLESRPQPKVKEIYRVRGPGAQSLRVEATTIWARSRAHLLPETGGTTSGCVRVYVDDIVICTHDAPSHLNPPWLRAVSSSLSRRRGFAYPRKR